ncbi:MAG: hypothetical protein WAU70_07845 [Flavobacteriales bacterium]
MAHPRNNLKRLLRDHPKLHDELFEFFDLDLRQRALHDLDNLTLGELTRLTDRALYITLTRIIHRPRPDNTCRGKFIYTQEGANRMVKKIWNQGRGRMRIYLCPLCQGHHLTHKADRFAD